MTIEGQVTEALEILKDIQTKVSTPPAVSVDFTPVINILLAIQEGVTNIKADLETAGTDTVPGNDTVTDTVVN